MQRGAKRLARQYRGHFPLDSVTYQRYIANLKYFSNNAFERRERNRLLKAVNGIWVAYCVLGLVMYARQNTEVFSLY